MIYFICLWNLLLFVFNMCLQWNLWILIFCQVIMSCTVNAFLIEIPRSWGVRSFNFFNLLLTSIYILSLNYLFIQHDKLNCLIVNLLGSHIIIGGLLNNLWVFRNGRFWFNLIFLLNSLLGWLPIIIQDLFHLLVCYRCIYRYLLNFYFLFFRRII